MLSESCEWESFKTELHEDTPKQGNEPKKMWLVVEWKSPANVYTGYCLISNDDLADNLRFEDYHTGKLINVKYSGTIRPACIVIVSADKAFLEMELKHLQEAAYQIGLTKKTPVQQEKPTSSPQAQLEHTETDEDYAHSGTDWHPSASEEDSDNSDIKRLKIINMNMKRINTKKPKPPSKPQRKRQKRISVPERSTSYSRQASTSHTSARSSIISSSIQIQRRQPLNFPSVMNLKETNHVADKFEEIVNKSTHGLINMESPKLTPQQAFTHRDQPAPPMTFDQQTQTNYSDQITSNITNLYQNQRIMGDDIGYINQVLEEMGQRIDMMQRTIHNLTNGKMVRRSTADEEEEPIQNGGNSNTSENQDIPLESNIILRELNTHPVEIISDNSSNGQKPSFYPSTPVTYQRVPTPNHPSPNEVILGETAASDMIPIGSGKTYIPRHIYNQIKWTSYSNATRKLLMAVFPRRTLATHSLTGKSSPAFTNKPAKMKLDAKKISDIIMTVSQMCKVQENLVRNVITTKCSDENKMYKTRQERMKHKKRDVEVNQENESP